MPLALLFTQTSQWASRPRSHFGDTCSPVALMGGTLTLWPGCSPGSSVRRLAGRNEVQGRVLVFCTLLGPEGPGRCLRVLTELLWTSVGDTVCGVDEGVPPVF